MHFQKALILGFSLLMGTSFAQVRAVTEKGDNVILFDDGTWRSADQLNINQTPHLFDMPTFKGVAAPGTELSRLRFSIESSKQNDITDDEVWFSNNDLSLPVHTVPNSFRGIKGEVPDGTPLSFRGEMLIRASYSDEHQYFVYGKNFSEGRYLIITDKLVEKALHVLDFKNYMLSPEYLEEDRMFIDQSIGWVEVENNILYISHGHRTYAKSSKGMNAYITAIDLNTYNVLWRSKPLQCNTHNFILYDDAIVTGYGFTAEKDYLYVLDKQTGNSVQQILVKSGPDYVIRKEDKLFVRTYNMDYVLRPSE